MATIEGTHRNTISQIRKRLELERAAGIGGITASATASACSVCAGGRACGRVQMVGARLLRAGVEW
jgi:hypothetical protein